MKILPDPMLLFIIVLDRNMFLIFDNDLPSKIGIKHVFKSTELLRKVIHFYDSISVNIASKIGLLLGLFGIFPV